MLNKPWIWTIIIIIVIILVLRLANKPASDPTTGKIVCKDKDGNDLPPITNWHWFWYGCGKNWYREAATPAVIPATIIPSLANQNPAPRPANSSPCSREMIGYDANGNLNPNCGQAPCNPRQPGYDIYGRRNINCKIVPPPPAGIPVA